MALPRLASRVQDQPPTHLLPDIPRPPAWMADGLCAETDPEAFYPEKGGSTREGKAVCAGCPVRAECLEYALENRERHGIWGGLSERERRKLERAGRLKKPIEHGTYPGYQTHRRRGEQACGSCLAALASYRQSLRDAERGDAA